MSWPCPARSSASWSPGLLGVAAAAPAAALGWRLVRSPEQEVGAVIADPLAQSLFALAGIMLLVLIGREGLLLRLDAWIHPEAADQRQVLAAATAALAKAEWVTTIGRRVTRAVRRGCGSPSILLVAPDAKPDAHNYRAPDTAVAPLPRTAAVVHLLETSGRSVRVHPSDRNSVFEPFTASSRPSGVSTTSSKSDPHCEAGAPAWPAPPGCRPP